MFNAVPEHVAFDIEVKMTTPDDMVHTPAEEVQRMVNSIMRLVSQCNANNQRTIVFSSFDPDVCTELRQRQAQHPVMFLSTGGADPHPHADPRRNSLQAAVQFATEHSLSGIIVDTSALRAEQEVVQLAKGQGLTVCTYGLENDSPEWVLQQAHLGVHAAIVDDVVGVLAMLQKQLEEGGERVVVPQLERMPSLVKVLA